MPSLEILKDSSASFHFYTDPKFNLCGRILAKFLMQECQIRLIWNLGKAPVDTQMVYLLIKGPSYRGLNFNAREKVRESLRKQLETHGIRFVEYGWVWDEEDRCLLVEKCTGNHGV